MRIPRPQRSQLGVAALVVAALALGQVLYRYLPESEPARPFLTAASSDGTHHLRFGDLRVTKVVGSSRVKGQTSIDPTLRTPGMFVVVTFRWTPLESPDGFVPSISYGELHDGGERLTTFSLSGDRTRVSCAPGPLRVSTTCFAVVEADPRTLPGSRLILGNSHFDERYDSVAEINLRISGADVRRWRAAGAITPPPPGTAMS